MIEKRFEELTKDGEEGYEVQDRWLQLAAMRQNTVQYNNYGAVIYKDTETNKIYYYEDGINEYTLYELENFDFADEDNYDDLLKSFVTEWAACAFEPELDRFAWGLSDPEKEQVTEEYKGTCKILEIGNYYGYTPIKWAKDERGCDDLTFNSYADAKKWINAAEKDIYRLGHNEANRPDYYIMAEK